MYTILIKHLALSLALIKCSINNVEIRITSMMIIMASAEECMKNPALEIMGPDRSDSPYLFRMVLLSYFLGFCSIASY